MAFNGDYTEVAIGVGREVYLFSNGDASENLLSLKRSQWVKNHVFRAHDLTVSDIDWDGKSNKIITCSHDRNAFVWSYNEEENEWKHGLVILRITRGALKCKWSPEANKFAVTSGAKRVPVCRYEPSENWWIAEVITKHKSSVISVDWHPNNQVLATGSTDFKCRIISAYVSKADGDSQDASPFESAPFGEVLEEFDCKGWVLDVAFSPSGEKLAYIGQDSSVTVIDCTNLEQVMIKTNILPFTAIIFVDETKIIAAGHNFAPFALTVGDDAVTLGACLDIPAEAPKEKKELSAMQRFQNQDRLGQESKTADLSTKHQAPITCMVRCGSSYATAGTDGRLAFWTI
jgi:actin related protein 2/3 complex subunit 1A/1B